MVKKILIPDTRFQINFDHRREAFIQQFHTYTAKLLMFYL